MRDYLVSVIVPAYNSEAYIRRCLDSLVNQTLDSLEIVVVNDGSTDGTLSILQEYADNNDNIVLINQKNGGIAKARAAGYLACRGKYIGWTDNDDFVESDMFEKMYKKAETENADYVYCDYDFFPQKVKTKEKWYKKYKGVVDWNFIERNTHPWNKLVRRDLCDEIEMGKALLEFSDSVYVGLLLHAKKIVCMEDVLYHYRVGHGSVSGSYKGRLPYYQEVSQRAKKQKVFLVGTKYEQSLQEYFEYRYFYSLIQVCIVAAINGNRKIYNNARYELERSCFRQNKYIEMVLKNNYGTLKALVLEYIIPANYSLSKIVCSLVFG